MSSPSSSSAVLKQLTRALSLLTADARAAKVPLPVPFQSYLSFGEDRSTSSSSSSTSSSSSLSSFSAPPLLLRAALGGDDGASDDLDASFARLRRLREQVEFLASTPPDVRRSLSLWRDLLVREGRGGLGGDEEGEGEGGPATSSGGGGVLLSSEALSFERGALLLPSVARPPEALELGGSSSSDADDGDETEEELSAERVSAALDDAALAASDALAAATVAGRDGDGPPSVRALARLLFDGDASSSSRLSRDEGESNGTGRRRSTRLFVVPRLRPAAVEWLYDGLGPLFPGAVLRRGQRLALGSGSSSGGGGGGSGSVGVGAGAPIALAAVASALARRLGVWTVPVPAESAEEAKKKCGGEAASALASPSLSAHLSPSVAARMAARTPAAAPETGKWLLACPLGEWVWDPSTGEVVFGGEEAESRWPLAGFRKGGSARGGGSGPSPSPFLLPPTSPDPRVGWAALLRACVVAHTRRGDSDAVAAVLPQLLALDGGAPEWAQVLRASEVVARR